MFGSSKQVIPEPLARGLGVAFGQSQYLIFAQLSSAREKLASDKPENENETTEEWGISVARELQQMADSSALAIKQVLDLNMVSEEDADWLNRAIGNYFQLSKSCAYLETFLKTGRDESLDTSQSAFGEARAGIFGLLGIPLPE